MCEPCRMQSCLVTNKNEKKQLQSLLNLVINGTDWYKNGARSSCVIDLVCLMAKEEEGEEEEEEEEEGGENAVFGTCWLCM